MVQSYELTLNRWHKVSERLSREATGLAKEIRSGFNETEVRGYLGEHQQQRLQSRAEQLAAGFGTLYELQDFIVLIRQASSSANETLGINSSLPRYDMLNKRLRFLESIVESQYDEKIMLDDLPSMPGVLLDSDDHYSKAKFIGVRIMSDMMIETVKSRIETDRQESYVIADQIAEKNNSVLKLEIPDHIALKAGLVGSG